MHLRLFHQILGDVHLALAAVALVKHEQSWLAMFVVFWCLHRLWLHVDRDDAK